MDIGNARSILAHFCINSMPVEIKTINTGHINTTFLVMARKPDGKQVFYTLQEVNQYVFKHPEQVMENIFAVTEHLKKKVSEENGNASREVLSIVPGIDGRHFYIDEAGRFWRLYHYIDKASTYDTVKEKQHLFNAGKGFGIFQKRLADFPIEKLHETIPDFHNTQKRLKTFYEVLSNDPCNRAAEAKAEIAFIEKNIDAASTLVDLQEKGELPLRVTHNDTKYNNILIDDDTGEALCVIDLDTVMPGLAASDFGDAIRYAANTAAEDESDVSKVHLDMELYEQFTAGFIHGASGLLTPKELRTLPHGALVLTLELVIRFLTDYLNGDKYFKISRPDHNLDRTRSQLALAVSMQKQFDNMCKLVETYI